MKSRGVGDMEVKQAVVMAPDGTVSVDNTEFSTVDEALRSNQGAVILKTSIEAMTRRLRNTGGNPRNKKAASMSMSKENKRRIAGLLRAAATELETPAKPTKVSAATKDGFTIYCKGVIGIDKVEAKAITSVTPHAIEFTPIRGKRTRIIMTYYSPFILVLPGRGYPEPDAKFGPEEESKTAGVTTSKGRYRGSDPRWVTDMMAKLGNVKPLVKFEEGKLIINKLGKSTEEDNLASEE